MTLPTLGVVIVTFNAADVVLDCLESLLAADGVRLDIVVVDNASNDTTIADLRDWAAGTRPYTVPDTMPFALGVAPKPVPLQVSGPRGPQNSGHHLTLIETGLNGGFAAGVNRGLAELAARPGIDRFWILNPDSAVPPATPRAFATCAAGDFSLLGGRVLYYDKPGMIQIDGGTINRNTGVTGNISLFRKHAETAAPSVADMDFITGASMVASRTFYNAAGPMPEEYFLYYEEVDWAQRCKSKPLAYCPEAIIYHRAGASIGSPTQDRLASPFSIYFKHRARLMFMRRYFPARLPIALVYSLAKAAQLALRGHRREAVTLLLASFNLPPPAHVRAKLSEDAARRAFAKHRVKI
ncbi:hypothetical protein P775_05710 [Puniceibacterium antarcticum]|uniref:Glycosyltransferase 2-like domain-containing protein n=1 Tax=Puniceibacterium antarcticum TaxID=1206336 RepID=A0A2G8RHY9_9RHOB|nr:glycosyltransferase family 2 protein [Puniceibacterium antarcticum]PIL21177.1 hypothetical protein P775_05710 [Puniceibacterium antarcticum]